MIYRTLGRTGLKVSAVGFGAWQFGGEWNKTFTQTEASALLARARDKGVTLIDTAECYGDGTSERFIGEFLKTETRANWVIATKFGHQFHDLFNRSDHWTPAEVLKQLDESLARLQTEYIDLYQFHSGGDAVFDQPELWAALAKAKAAGKIRFLGISIGSNDNLHQTSSATRVGADTIQVVYNRLDRKSEGRVLPSCAEQNLGVLARVPLASGFLSGKYKPGDEGSFPKNDVRGKWWTPDGIAETLKNVAEIKAQEVPAGADMASWALAWVLKHPAVTCVIPGMKSLNQVDANAAAADLVATLPARP